MKMQLTEIFIKQKTIHSSLLPCENTDRYRPVLVKGKLTPKYIIN
jgi:hypothetical protein